MNPESPQHTSSFRAEWTIDAAQESREVLSYLWSRRPPTLRWPILIAVGALIVVALIVAPMSGSPFIQSLTVVLVVLAVLFAALALVMIFVLRRALRTQMPRDGSPSSATVSEEGWNYVNEKSVKTLPWGDLNTWAVHGDSVFVLQARSWSWMPALIARAPLSGFGSDAERVIDFLSQRLAAPKRTLL